MAIVTENIKYKDLDTECIGFIAYDESNNQPRPCVIVSHAWSGLDDFTRETAKQIASHGYIGFAIDNYGNGKSLQSVAEKQSCMKPFLDDRKMLLTRLQAGLSTARKLPQTNAKIAIIGFCFGGLCALDLARSGEDIKATISYHGLLSPPHGLEKKPITSKVLVCHGWDDPMVPPQHVIDLGSELTEAQCDWQIHAYGQTSHAFTMPTANDAKLGLKYNKNSADRAFLASRNLLEQVFSEE